MTAAIARAERAGVPANAIGYINAHGTGTPLNDRTEAWALHEVFGEHARDLPVSSTKSMHGHAQGAAGALEAVATLLALRNRLLPPTANFNEPDPECDLDLVVNTAREAAPEYAISNTFGYYRLDGLPAGESYVVSVAAKRYAFPEPVRERFGEPGRPWIDSMINGNELKGRPVAPGPPGNSSTEAVRLALSTTVTDVEAEVLTAAAWARASSRSPAVSRICRLSRCTGKPRPLSSARASSLWCSMLKSTPTPRELTPILPRTPYSVTVRTTCPSGCGIVHTSQSAATA